MSLLLEALKKAELAKQNAAQQQGEGAPASESTSTAGLSLEPLVGNSVEPPNITRDRLPDITQPLEILSEDLPSAGIRRPPPAPSPPLRISDPEPTVQPAPAFDLGDKESRTIRGPAAEDADRASVRQLFEAKSVDYNPRRPFFIVVGVLAVVGVAAAAYFMYQIAAPQPSYYAGPAGGAKASQPIATAASPTPAPQPAPAPAPMARSSVPAQTLAQADEKPAAPSQPAPDSGGIAAKPGTPRTAAPKRASSQPPSPPSEAASASPSRISVSPSTQTIEPGVERGWSALQAGNLDAARDEYVRVLKANPMNRDALLGLAAIDARNRDFESAEARYLRLLEIDPRDPYAQAGVIALRGQIDPVQSESRLKNLLAQQPDATFLNFALGNQYATQNRWPDAQAAYFKAYAADPENADYAFNLAVSLDHLRQSKLALEYYQRALALAALRTAGFDRARTETRIRELQR